MAARARRRAAVAVPLLALAALLVRWAGPLTARPLPEHAYGRTWREPVLVSFHVVASSDRPEDQALKRRVRDALSASVLPLVATASSPGEAEERVRRYSEAILRTAEEELRRAGSADPVRLDFDRQGDRRAVRLVIGAGAGHNWFCVLYPPLCLVVRGEGPATAEPTLPAFRLDPTVPDTGQAPIEIRSALVDWLRSARSRVAARGLLGLLGGP